MIKSTLTLLVALTIYSTPIHYDDWKTDNSFLGGFEGFVDYYTQLTPQNKALYDLEGNYSTFGVFKDQTKRDWLKSNGLKGKGKYKYQVIKG